MEKQSKITIHLKNIFLVTASILIIAFFVAQFIWDDGYSFQKPEITQLTEEASLMLRDGTILPLKQEGDHFFYKEAQPNEIVTVIMTLPEFQETDMCLCVFSANQNIGVFVDGVLREYYNDESFRLVGSYSASHFVKVPLDLEDSGKEIRITYQTSLAECAGILTCPLFGTETSLILWMFRSYFWQIVSALLLFTVGIVFIVLGVVIKYNRNHNQGLCYLGVFSIIMALWILCKSNMRIFYCRNLNTTNLMTYMAIMVAPMPMLIFLNDLMKYRYQKVFNTVIAACLLNTAFSLVVTLSDVTDLVKIIWTTRVLIVAGSLVSIACFLDYLKTKELKAPQAVGVGLFGCIAAIVVEDINTWDSNTLDVGKYIGFGILFFLLMLAYAAEKSWVVQWKDYRKAIEENEFKNAFLANMSHEIKTPINTILGMNEMIASESREQGVRCYARHIQEAGNMLLALVNNILDYTKLESGKMQIIPVSYELGQLLSNLINSVSIKVEEKKLSFEVDVDKNIPSVLYGDELRIRQAVLNLLTNAIKYTREGSISLKVAFERVNQKEICIYISVTDTGIGIRKEDRERLYDSFVRLEEKRNRSIEGAGLGMTITRQIMDMMQGDILIESEYGKGSTFTLSFKQQIVEETALGDYEDWYRAKIHNEVYQDSDYLATGVKLLVIDDNEMNLEVIRGLLKKTMAQIDTALSGEEGLTKVRKEKYDLILLDQMMPGMDGVETLRRLLAMEHVAEKKIPVIALTANSVVGAREEYLKQGFTDYIAKPVDYRTLIACLRKYLPDKIEKCLQRESKQARCEIYLSAQGIQVKSAMKYAGDEFGQYIHLLELFCFEKGQEKQEALQQAYDSRNWKDYTTHVHGLKNSARTIGADNLADMAYEHEQKSKKGEIAFVQEAYCTLIQEWERTRGVIESYLALYREENEELPQADSGKMGLIDNAWEEILEQAVHYLEEYKKKEALALLIRLSQDNQVLEEIPNLQQAIAAVRDYDYESAIQLLRDR